MRSALSSLRKLAVKFIGAGAPQFVAPEGVDAEQQPRLMVELRGRNRYGRALLYVPNEGLFSVRPDGTTQHLRDSSFARYEEGDVVFPTYHPIGAGQTVRFAGPGSKSIYYYSAGESVVLVEMPSIKFDVAVDPFRTDGLARTYRVTLR